MITITINIAIIEMITINKTITNISITNYINYNNYTNNYSNNYNDNYY